MNYQVGLKSGTSPAITTNNGGTNIETQDSSGEVYYSWQRLAGPG